MNQYYTDERRLRVSRFRNMRGERYSFTNGCWEYDQELYDVLIGELWLDEISEEEANEIIARRTGSRHSG